MKKLIIDCSYGMNVFLETETDSLSFVDHDQKKHTDNLLVQVDNILNMANIKIKDIDVFCVLIGPGSFTGIRVAVSIVKGLAINSAAKICVASNFDIIDTGETNCCYVLDGFSNYIYVRTVSEKDQVDECVQVDEFVNRIRSLNNKLKIYAQNEKMQNLLKSYEIQSEIAENYTISCFNKKIENNNFIKINEINPIYLRASQAEIERQKKLENNNEC